MYHCITFSECVFEAQLATMQFARVILPPVACPALHYFSTLSHKRYIFRKQVTGLKMCVLSSSTTFAWKMFHSRPNWARYYKKKCILVFIFSTDFSETWIFSDSFEKYSNIKFHENPSGGSRSCSMRTDARTDRYDEASVALRNFANAPK